MSNVSTTRPGERDHGVWMREASVSFGKLVGTERCHWRMIGEDAGAVA